MGRSNIWQIEVHLLCNFQKKKRIATNNINSILNISSGLLSILPQVPNKSQNAFLDPKYCAEISRNNSGIELSKCITCGGTKKEQQDSAEG